jgi:cytochrome c biogenesis protein
VAVQSPRSVARPGPGPARQPFGQTVRQAWREFRSMRTALILLFAIATASILGSLFPQRGLSPRRVDQYLVDHPGIGPVLDRLGMFDVFGSAWFTAIYVALLTALVACLVPRARAFARLVRARPPRSGARLDRYRNAAAFDAALPPEQALAAAGRVLRRRRYRVAVHGDAVAAEKGYLREAGSLLFHVSFLLLLVGLAYGKGWGYRGQVTLVEGDTITNTRVNYDAFTPGRWYGPEQLPPFSLRLDDFANSFWPSGQPRDFASRLTAVDAAGRTRRQRVGVNRPMTVDGTRVFQSDYGYAPVVKVTLHRAGGRRSVPQDGPLLTLRDQATEVSNGAVKLTMLDPQVGLDVTMFTGFQLAPGPDGRAEIANDPRLVNPLLVVFPWRGDLHADRAQSVFTLDRTDLRPLADRPLLIPLGATRDLPGGLGTVSFTGVRQYTVLTLARDPGVPIVLAAAVLILLGLLPSLYVTRRRVWVRAVPARPGAARVEVAGLALQGKTAFVDEFADLQAELGRELHRSPPTAGRDTLGDGDGGAGGAGADEAPADPDPARSPSG